MNKHCILLCIIFVKFFLPIIPTFHSAPDATSFLTDYSSTCYTFRIYTYFRFQVFFLMFLIFTCAPVHPSTCFHFSFHMLWLCSRPFPSYHDILYFLCFIFVTLPIHPDAVYKPMYLSSSSSVCKLMLIPLLSHLLSKSPLPSQSSLYSLVALLVLW